jgi:hypothetical protein
VGSLHIQFRQGLPEAAGRRRGDSMSNAVAIITLVVLGLIVVVVLIGLFSLVGSFIAVVILGMLGWWAYYSNKHP